MSISKHDLQQWLDRLPEDAMIGIDEGGLSLESTDSYQTHYLDVGGIPDADDDTTYCDECGNAIPDTCPTVENLHHAESCSLYTEVEP